MGTLSENTILNSSQKFEDIAKYERSSSNRGADISIHQVKS